jgi:LPS-assembly protein
MNRSGGNRRKQLCRRQAALALIAAALLSSPAARAEDSSADEATANAEDCSAVPFLDWTTALETGETALRSQRCGGSFLDPLAGVDTSADPAQQPIEATADRSELEGDMVRFFGSMEARQGYRLLRASQGEFNRATGFGTLLGDVELREPGLLLRGATGSIDTRTGEARLTAGQIVLHEQHMHGGADLMLRRSDGNINLDDAAYSYCPPMQESWILKADEVELNLDEGFGIARDATIELGGVPIIYTPYLEFPLDDRRKTGFLWADIGDDSRGGLDLATPYYFNLAPNYDATFTPRYIDERGLLTELELRYLSRAVGYWEVGGAWISGDDEYQLDRPNKDGDRWLATGEQRGLFEQRWRTRIDFTKTSDDEYFSDIDTTSLDARQSTELLQLGQVDYLGDNWLATLKLEDFQTISRDVVLEPYATLPQLNVTRTRASENFALNLLWETEYSRFDHGDRIEGHRLYNSVGADFPMQAVWGFFTPTVKYRQINYDLDEQIRFDGAPDDTPSVGAPMFSLDTGLFFERYTRWGLQTLEPRVYYLWSDYQDQTGLPDFDTSRLTFAYDQLFRDTRFSGHDRIDDAKQVSVGVTTRFHSRETGRELLVAGIGQIYYFEDREIDIPPADPFATDGSSQIAAQFGLSPAENWDFRSEWQWNTQEKELEQTSVQFGWAGPGEAILNLGYSYRRNRTNANLGRDINQVDISSYVPVTRDWRIFFRSLYSIENRDRVNDLAGIEYNSCCWRVRLAYQRFADQRTNQNNPELVEYENAIYVQIQFKGLGGIGSTIADVMEENIRGYENSDL